MKKSVFLILLSIASFCNSQTNFCGTDFLRNTLKSNNPAYGQKEENVNHTIYQRTVSQAGTTRQPLTTYTIPVVVDIVHNNGSENISDALVIAGINEMNLRFRNAAPYFDSTGHETGIQFCLASIDPQGNPTTGITRDVSLLTYFNANNDLQLKNLNRWDPLYYYNIWVVSYITGFNISVAGYSSLPSNLGDNADGAVIDHFSITGNVLSHESGHYLGLLHTFDGGCINDNCLLNGDYVCDTPPDTSMSVCRGNSCSSDMNDTSGFNPFVGDMNELPNYMDYTPCPLSFSQGQADRMNNALAGIRFLLLQSTGCGFSGGPPPVATISYTISQCYDGVVTFSDSLTTHANTVNWDFDNNGTYESGSHSTSYTFPATGTYTVKLKVAGPGGVDSSYQTIFVQKSPSHFYPISMNGGVFQNSNSVWVTCNYYPNYFSAPPNAQSYLWSTGDTTQSISFIPSADYSLYLTIVDSAGLTWTNQFCYPLTVTVNEPPPAAIISTTDPLTICNGDSVVFHATIDTSSNYIYTWYENGGGGTGIHDSVFTAIGFAYGIQYQVIGDANNACYSYSNLLYVYSYTPPAIQSLTQNGMQLTTGWGGGNQWYQDGIAIPGANGSTYTVTQPGCYSVEWYFGWAPACTTMSDTICFATVSINEINEDNGIAISPNPFSLQTTITFNEEQRNTTLKIIDVLGKEIKTMHITGKQALLEKGEMEKGIYFVQIISENRNDLNIKIVVQ